MNYNQSREILHFGVKAHSDDLMHFGVKGMKWGVRNAKGYVSNKVNLFKADKAVKRDNRDAYKNRKNLSDQELRDRTQRLQLENNYKRAIQDSKSGSFRSEVVRAAVPVLMAAATAGTTHYVTTRVGNSETARRLGRKAVKKSKLTAEQWARVINKAFEAANIKSMPKKK